MSQKKIRDFHFVIETIVVLIAIASLSLNYYQWRQSRSAKLIGKFRYKLPYVNVETGELGFSVFVTLVNSGEKKINPDFYEIYYYLNEEWKRSPRGRQIGKWVRFYERFHFIPKKEWEIDPFFLDSLYLAKRLLTTKPLSAGDMNLGWGFVTVGIANDDNLNELLATKLRFEIVDISGKRYSFEGQGMLPFYVAPGYDFQAGLTIFPLTQDAEKEVEIMQDIMDSIGQDGIIPKD